MIRNKINTYIITGFLGAGKTTYLNKLLSNCKDSRNTVIENEFGKINIDKELITNHYDAVFDLANGCICCTSQGELLNTISQIGFTGNRPDNLFVECTGIADVNKITSTFKLGDFEEVFTLRPVICVVDCTIVLDFIEKTIETSLQIVGSDWILLNKSDHVEIDKIEEIKAVISTINPYVQFKKSEDVTIENLSNSSHNENKDLPIISKNVSNPHKINTILFESDNIANLAILRQVFTSILYFYTDTFYRVKGFINGEDGNTYELQLAAGSFKLIPHSTSRKSQLVFIGRVLEKSSIDRLMRPIFKK